MDYTLIRLHDLLHHVLLLLLLVWMLHFVVLDPH
jgi:hypothetical protein